MTAPNKMTDKQLSLWLGEVLQPEKIDHIEAKTWKIKRQALCGKCCEWYDVDIYGHPIKPCPIPDPIPLDWPNAMKFFRQAVKDCGEMAAGKELAKTLGATDDYSLLFLLISKARPRDYLIAAAKLKEQDNG